MASYYDELIGKYEFENPLNKIVYEVVSCIKNNKDYINAAGMMIQNKLTLEDIVSRTVRLSSDDFIILADTLISRK